jgi:ribonuclease Z
LPAFARILEAWAELQADTDRCDLVGLEPGDRVPLKNGYALAFASLHRIECLGYVLFARVRKLKPELNGLSGPQIAERARAGEEVNQWIERPELCFPGDSRIEVVEREPLVRTARVLLLECTFVGAEVSAAKAKRGGHIHLDQIAERAELFENEVVVLTHFSRRHSRQEIESEIARRIPAPLAAKLRLILHDP